MILAIDIGNAEIDVGAFEGMKRFGEWSFRSDPQVTADEYGLMILSALEWAGISPDMINDAIIGSVAPKLTGKFSLICKWCFQCEPLVLTPSLELGISIDYSNPQSLGADRIANAVAAYYKKRTASIIVDAGTATTIDVVSGEGVFLGGAILPGVAVQCKVLRDSTAQLPEIEPCAMKEGYIGKSTQECINIGVLHGHALLIEGLVGEYKKVVGEDAYVVATGGWGEILQGLCPSIEEYDKTLTLEGLKLIYYMNRKNTKMPQ